MLDTDGLTTVPHRRITPPRAWPVQLLTALLIVGSGCILDNPDFDGESASAGEMTLSTGSETSPATSLDTTPTTSSTGASLSDTDPTEPTTSPATVRAAQAGAAAAAAEARARRPQQGAAAGGGAAHPVDPASP